MSMSHNLKPSPVLEFTSTSSLDPEITDQVVKTLYQTIEGATDSDHGEPSYKTLMFFQLMNPREF
jgi:hypothetical protein